MKLQYCLLAILCPAMNLLAQIKPLSIGDTIPEIYIQSSANPKSRLTILDFWATWCGSCISSFPKMQQLQTKYKDSLQFLLVNSKETKDDSASVNRFFSKPANNYTFSSISEDTLLTQLFPHKFLPHYVWINANRVIVAITSSNALTIENIETTIKRQSINLKTKVDKNYNASLALLEGNNGGTSEDILYRSILTPHLEGIGGGTRIYSGSTYTKLCFLNYPILALYQYAVGFSNIHVLLELNDSTKIKPYCYEITFPIGDSMGKIKSLMATDLNRYLGLNGRLEQRMIECMIITSTKNDTKKIANPYIERIIRNWEITGSLNGNKPILLNEANLSSSQHIEIPQHAYKNIATLKQALLPFGLQIVPARRLITMFVLSN